jgi:ADP-ribose pyrophosphatase
MVRQYRNALDRFTLELPAGKLDEPGEPTLECAKRELEEETGYYTDDFEYLLTVNTTVAFCNEKIDLYVARNLTKTEQHLDPDEEINVEVWDVEDLKQLIYEGKMTDGKTVAGIMTYAAKYL